MVVLVLGSVFSDGFFPFVTLGFLPTVNGQPHRGISPPIPALWSRPRLGKKRHCLSLCVSSLTLQSLLQHLHLHRSSCWCFCLHPSCFLYVHPSINHWSVHPCCLLCDMFVVSSQALAGFQQSFWQQCLQIIKWMLKLELDYLSWLHKSSHNSRLCHCLFTVVGESVLNVWV